MSKNCADSKVILKLDDDALLKSSALPRLEGLLRSIMDYSGYAYAGTGINKSGGPWSSVIDANSFGL